MRKFLFCILCLCSIANANPPLASWHFTSNRQAIINFVEKITDPKSKAYVKVDDRIAVFDNDGTLWVEKPIYPQVHFVMDRLAAVAQANPRLKNQPMYNASLQRKWRYFQNPNVTKFDNWVLLAHQGMSKVEFQKEATKFIQTAKHPHYKKHYTELVYQPMIELLDYLRDHQFKVFMVTAGTSSFVRAFADEIYAIPPENVIATTVALDYDADTNKLVRMKKFRYPLVIGPGKAKSIIYNVGKKPIIAVGNSTGDLEMFKLATKNNKTPAMAILVHHDDADREYAYDKGAKRALLSAKKNKWLVVSMKKDFKILFPDELAH